MSSRSSSLPTASVVLDSVSPEGVRLTTFQVKFHRFVLAETNTHRVLSRNYRSSRAVPSEKLIEEVRTDPVMPVYWGKNKPGMQAREELTGEERAFAELSWRNAANKAADSAEAMARHGLHKQIANRVLEPFLWVHGVITATEFDNFFGLRLHADAQPEFRALADAMWKARKESTPTLLQPGEWHLPYVTQADRDAAHAWAEVSRPDRSRFVGKGSGVNYHDAGVPFHREAKQRLIKVSVARCARVSYKPFDADRPSTADEDIALHDKLVGAQPMHASPAEHQATPDVIWHGVVDRWDHPEEHGNLVGWRQYRKTIPGENRAPLPSEYQ